MFLLLFAVTLGSGAVGSNRSLANDAKWIWVRSENPAMAGPGMCYFRKTFQMKDVESGRIEIAAKDRYDLFVNGRIVGGGNNWQRIDSYDLRPYLTAGLNVIGVRVENQQPGPAGLVARVTVKQYGNAAVSHSTDATWLCTRRELNNWLITRLRTEGWEAGNVFSEFGRRDPWTPDVPLMELPQVAAEPRPPAEAPVALVPAPAPPAPTSPPVPAPAPAEPMRKEVPPAEAPVAKVPPAAVPRSVPQQPSATVDADLPALDNPTNARFLVAPNFRVERVAQPDATGSLVAMAFDERGDIIASRERGPLLRVRDDDGDGAPETVSVYCDLVQNCQGILPLNGDVFAVGDGPNKTGFYRISDRDGDGVGETVETLLRFKGGMQEHGPHAALLGPDGLIYLILGNHCSLDGTIEPTSPHGHYYEGDLVQPRYEDAGGHAVGIKAPGGVVLRTTLDGKSVEMFAGGFRNAYDFGFNKRGDLFAYDSDMEWDESLPWYRPTRINHVIPGAEFGWRSGWAKWPDYFIDSLPATVNTGRGSPTGVECYNHYRYPVRYHDALFVCDWSLGRIIVARMEPAFGTYAARSEVFLQGRPLNVTDIAVGPDGWLYFTTGGRDTEGGVYRVVYTGKAPPRPTEAGVMQAIRQPQLYSAWGRNRIANIKREMGDAWAPQLAALVEDQRYSVDDRIRALDLMQLVGPSPTTALLVRVSQDADPEVRAKATDLMGIHVDAATNERLVELTSDPDPTVCRKACEALVRAAAPLPVKRLVDLLSSPYRFVSWAAMRALQTTPRDQWEATVLETSVPRTFLMGSVGLLGLEPDRATADAIVANGMRMMQGFMTDDDFVGLLRVYQLALHRGAIPPDEARQLAGLLADEYPALEPRMNRELLRLLVYLEEQSVLPRMMDELARTDVSMEDKLHLAFYARFMSSGWTVDQKLELLSFLEQARGHTGGHSYAGYIDNVSRDFVKGMPEDERWMVVMRGASIPNAALMALAAAPADLPVVKLSALVDLDRDLFGHEGEAARRLGIGIVAVLGRSRHPQAMEYLREVYERQPDRRQEVVMGLAQSPEGENWDVLVRALPALDGAAAREVLMHLAEVDQAPEQPEPLRQAILAGLRLRENGSQHAVAVLERWTGQQLSRPEQSWDVALSAWQNWFAETYPDSPPAELPVESESNKWSYEQLLSFLTGDGSKNASPERGSAIYEKAQCVKCHKFGSRGEGAGPDLSGVARRFQKKEILEAVMFPSHVISDQYASKTVVTTDGLTYTGIVGASGNGGITVFISTGERIGLSKDNIEEIVPSNLSAMPEGLFNNLTLEEIADLFAYLGRPPVN
jgi:putative heme-binding domain-containing protein